MHTDTIWINGELADTEFVIDGTTYYFDGNVIVEFGWADHGIGAYECWGQRGVDTRMGVDGIKITELEIERVIEFDGADYLSDEKAQALAPALMVAMNENEKFMEAIIEKVEDGMADPYYH